MDQLTPQQHRELIKSQISGSYQPLEKAQDTDLEKGGEGSKGGKIIGHTKSGKPIYETLSHTGYSPKYSGGVSHKTIKQEYSAEDHKDAAETYRKQAASFNKENDPHDHKGAANRITASFHEDHHKEKSAVKKSEESNFSTPQERQQLIKTNILGSYSNADQLIEKGGKKMPIGTTHNGYKKVAEG